MNEDIIGLDMSKATPRVREIIEKWVQKEEARAVREERFEDAAGFRDLMQKKLVYLRRDGDSFTPVEPSLAPM